VVKSVAGAVAGAVESAVDETVGTNHLNLCEPTLDLDVITCPLIWISLHFFVQQQLIFVLRLLFA